MKVISSDLKLKLLLRTSSGKKTYAPHPKTLR
jgi:hypothetical protein